MASTKKLFDLTQLAEASYADLINANLGNALLTDVNGDSLFSSTQATEFATHWSVASHQANTFSGFSATLFENNSPRRAHSLAVRRMKIYH